MRIRLAVPDELDDRDRKAALDAALESVTRTNASLVRNGKAPPAAAVIKAGRIRWQAEPPGDEHFDLPETMLKRGWGDCDDLAPYHAGTLRASGVDPGARAIVRKSGPKRWHAVVQRSDGSIEDPSKHAGMGQGVNGDSTVLGAYAPLQPPMAADGRLCLAICPGKDPRFPHVWFARCDVPDRLEPWDWSSMAASHHPAKALLHAVKGCRGVAGDDMDPEDAARLAAVSRLLLGADPEAVAAKLARVLGSSVADAVVGEAAQSVGFFGDLFKAIASPITSTARLISNPSLSNLRRMATDPLSSALKAARPLAHIAKPFSGAIRFIPGIGPVAASAVDFIDKPPQSFEDLARFAAAQAPGFIPGVGPLLSQGGGLASMLGPLLSAGRGGAAGIPGLPGMLGPLLAAMQAGAHEQPARVLNAPRMTYDPGKLARPWGAGGPAVMRFM